jgi:GNAT superfamily N-acetyltransferase
MPIVSDFGAPRVAVPGDVPSLVDVINRAYVVEEFFITGTRTTEAQARELMAQPDVRFLVIDSPAGGIAASVCMKINGDRGYFSMLAVDPAYQGHGLARRLIEAVESACRAAGCHHLDIEVINLRTELPALYAKFGFTPHGTAPITDQHKLLLDAHAIEMTKPLV